MTDLETKLKHHILVMKKQLEDWKINFDSQIIDLTETMKRDVLENIAEIGVSGGVVINQTSKSGGVTSNTTPRMLSESSLIVRNRDDEEWIIKQLPGVPKSI